MVRTDLRLQEETLEVDPNLLTAFKIEPMNEQPRNDDGIVMELKDLSVWYGHFLALRHVSMPVARNRITSIIGPSGCGKSTLIRCLNRMNDLIPTFRAEGEVMYEG